MSLVARHFSVAFWFLMATQALASPVSTSVQMDVRAVLGRAEKALSGKAVRSDIVFMFAQGAKITGNTFELPLIEEIRDRKDLHPLLKLEYELWRMRNHDLPRMPRIAVTPEEYRPEHAAGLSRQKEVEQVLQMMQVTVTCQRQIDARASVGEPGFGYVSTHQVLALTLATSRGCITRNDFAREITPYVRRVYSELMRNLDKSTDVQVERAAFLVLVGRADLVPHRYLRDLLAKQSSDGLWHFDSPPDHTSALAYLALSSLLQPQGYQGRRGLPVLVPPKQK